jgi:nucleoid DNA-binding protein
MGEVHVKKQELRKALSATGPAADRLDAEVERIVRQLKQGKSVTLPGLGEFVPGPQPKFEFSKPKGAGRGRR